MTTDLCNRLSRGDRHSRRRALRWTFIPIGFVAFTEILVVQYGYALGVVLLAYAVLGLSYGLMLAINMGAVGVRPRQPPPPAQSTNDDIHWLIPIDGPTQCGLARGPSIKAAAWVSDVTCLGCRRAIAAEEMRWAAIRWDQRARARRRRDQRHRRTFAAIIAEGRSRARSYHSRR